MDDPRTIVEPKDQPAGGPGGLAEELITTSRWSDDLLQRHGIRIVDSPVVTVGGGLGSFAMADILRIAGIAPEQITALSDIEHPWDTYRYLASNSQIPDRERLRSDSGSTMDNIWAFPSYAIREAWDDKTPEAAWQVLTEPILTEYFTPRAGQVYSTVAREAERIDWERMRVAGHVRMVRKREGGGYFGLLTPPPDSDSPGRVAYRCRHLHLAVGYPGVKFLPDLQEYREKYGDYQRVVNAYEPHPHVYDEALRRPSTVLVRGSGIVASRVLQRLLDDRENNNAQTQVVHLFRNYVHAPQGDRRTFRRPGGNGFAFQAFNFPKAAWGGQTREELAALDGDERAAFIDKLGGTNTAPRKDWQRQLGRGARAGHYTQRVGTVRSVRPSDDRTSIITVVDEADGGTAEIEAQFIIDATGLEANLTDHRLMADLLEHSGAGRNPKGRLDVEPSFEIRGCRSDPGRMYASGSMTLGGYYAGVDSFLGLQYAALQIADDLAELGFGAHIGPARSISQWWKWMRNTSP